MSFEDRYAARTPRSKELFDRASRSIPAGAGSSARTVGFGWAPYPPFIEDGRGSRIRDVDGNEYIDYLLGLGPMILGHRHPVVTAAVTEAVSTYGTCFGLPYELEIEAAEKVVDAVPGIEMVRFTNSGSEAVGTAVRLARAFTGRRILVRFEGHYHGWQDVVYWSNHVDPAAAGPADRPRPVAAGPGVPLDGVGHRPGDHRVAVAQDVRPQAEQVVDVLVAVDVGEMRAGAGRDERRVWLPAELDGARAAAGTPGDELARRPEQLTGAWGEAGVLGLEVHRHL